MTGGEPAPDARLSGTDVNLTGNWRSWWIESEDKQVVGSMELQQNGSRVTGVDRAEGAAYTIEATLQRDTLVGVWDGAGYRGILSLTVKDDGQILDGTYTTEGEAARKFYRAEKLPGPNT